MKLYNFDSCEATATLEAPCDADNILTCNCIEANLVTTWFIVATIEIRSGVAVKDSMVFDCKLSFTNLDQYVRTYSGERLTHQTSNKWTFRAISDNVLKIIFVVPQSFVTSG